MSKPSSGLVTGTKGAQKIASLTTASILKNVMDHVNKMIANTKDGKKKAVAIGAYDSNNPSNIVTAFAGEIPSIIHPELLKRAVEIGGIGSHGLTERNIIGVCAEFQVVNKLLWSGVKWEDIRLSKAIRPRTGQTIPYCANCQKMFYDIIKRGE